MQKDMTVQDILDAIHIAYEQATDTPPLTDEDGAMRLNLLQKGVRRWGRDNTTAWTELFSIVTIGPIVAGQQDYNIDDPTDDGPQFNFPEAIYLEGSDAPMKVRAPRQITGVAGRYVTFLGDNKNGHKVHLGWNPTDDDAETGKTMTLLFYRDPFVPTAVTDRVEMSDAQYLVAYVTAELFVNDDADLYAKFNGDALNLLTNMRQRNDMVAQGQYNGMETQDGSNDTGIGGGI